jgi:hypothetical protein
MPRGVFGKFSCVDKRFREPHEVVAKTDTLK